MCRKDTGACATMGKQGRPLGARPHFSPVWCFSPMPKRAVPATVSAPTGAALGFEATLWAAADKLRNNLDAAEYKHVVLGLIFLKYISDAFEEHHAWLLAQTADPRSELFVKNPAQRAAVAEDRDEYLAENIFWVPSEARWQVLQAHAKQPTIGQRVDEAMTAIERDNPALRGVLPKDYARPALDKRRLGELIDLVSGIGLGSRANRARDVLGRVYEYFLAQFASAEGKRGGQFYTPQSVVQTLVALLAPYKGRIYDPCCGSGGMFVQSEKFVEAHGGRVGDIAVYGQESNPTTWRLAKMNLAIRGIDNNLGAEYADSFHRDLHPDLKADFILANPPFNMSDWGGERLREDGRWVFGVPPAGNANYAWIQHFIHHLAPRGVAGFVLANGSMSSNSGGEGEIRKAIIEAGLVECMVALPGQLFYSTQIPVCLWFVRRGRPAHAPTLFVDARQLGVMTDRTHRELTEADIARIADTYHAWRGDAMGNRTGGFQTRPNSPNSPAGPNTRPGYADVPGFCKSASLEEMRAHNHVLTPGRYVGAAEVDDDTEPIEAKLARLTATLEAQFAESATLEQRIRENLKKIV